MKPNYIIVHTAALRGRNGDAGLIDSWHRQKGLAGIGFHFVILNDRHDTKSDGLVEKGRPDQQPEAHAKIKGPHTFIGYLYQVCHAE